MLSSESGEAVLLAVEVDVDVEAEEEVAFLLRFRLCFCEDSGLNGFGTLALAAGRLTGF
jgi:hypothetical protein